MFCITHKVDNFNGYLYKGWIVPFKTMFFIENFVLLASLKGFEQ